MTETTYTVVNEGGEVCCIGSWLDCIEWMVANLGFRLDDSFYNFKGYSLVKENNG